MTITTKTSASEMEYNFSLVSLHVQSREVNGKIYWYADNSENLETRSTKTTRGCGRIRHTVGNPWKRISKAAAAEILAEYDITLEQFRAYENGELEIVEVTMTEQNTVEENVKADTTADNREPELIKHNGVSFEGFLATNTGLTIEEYRARKDEQQAAEQAEAERRTKIFNLKSEISGTEYKINETSGTLNDIIKNHYRPESDDGSWDEYTAELGDTLATAVSTLNTLKAQLAELEPAIVEDNTDNTTEDNVEAEPATEPREGDWEISNKLTRKLNRNVRLSNYTEVITQDGERTFVNFKAPYVEPDGNTDHGFTFYHYDTVLGTYETREQTEAVINLIKATIERGEEKFTFPTVDELNQPSKDDLRSSLERAAEIAHRKYHEYEREGDKVGMLREIELFSICTDAIKELEAA